MASASDDLIEGITVDYCGEEHPILRLPFVIGRDADLDIDDNPFLHRRFLTIYRDPHRRDVILIANIGDRLVATIADDDDRLQAQLGPGAALPLVTHRTTVRFSAGPTAYEFVIVQPDDFAPPAFANVEHGRTDDGAATSGRISLTDDQRLLVLALAESALRAQAGTKTSLPSNGDAAARLGWTKTKFIRKLDNVCDRLTQLGVRGLHGGAGQLASNRRARLVEYAMSSRLVTRDDLDHLDRAHELAGDDQI